MDRELPKLSPEESQQREGLRAEMNDDDVDRQFAIDAANLLRDFECEDVMVLDVRGMSDITNFLVLATGTSDRQIRSLGGRVKDLADEHKLDLFGHERDDGGEATSWVVLDFVNVVVHLFDPSARAHYDLDMLWGDAERIKWRKPRVPRPGADDASNKTAAADDVDSSDATD
jgi:ribosome-associated protein